MKIKTRSFLTQIRRTPYQALGAIILTTVTFFIISLFSLLSLGTHQLLTYFASRPQVIAFFTNQASPEDIFALRDQLNNTHLVKKISYTSKQQALQIYKQQVGDNPLLSEIVTADFLPASLEISTYQPEDLQNIADILSKNNLVEDVVYQKDIVEPLTKWIRGMKVVGLSLACVFLLATFITLAVIIGLKTANKKEEINILALLGASPWYIKKPFLAEGIFYGVFGAILGWGSVYLLLLYLTPNLLDFTGGLLQLPFSPQIMLILLAIQISLGFIIGLFTSLFATRRYGK